MRDDWMGDLYGWRLVDLLSELPLDFCLDLMENFLALLRCCPVFDPMLGRSTDVLPADVAQGT